MVPPAPRPVVCWQIHRADIRCQSDSHATLELSSRSHRSVAPIWVISRPVSATVE